MKKPLELYIFESRGGQQNAATSGLPCGTLVVPQGGVFGAGYSMFRVMRQSVITHIAYTAMPIMARIMIFPLLGRLLVEPLGGTGVP